MHVHYFYDLPVPSPFAAYIQILHTCRALSELGARVTVHTGPLQAESPEVALQHYGLAPHERLRLTPAFDGGRGERQRVRRTLDVADPATRRFVLSRGESGLKLFGYLRGRPWRPEERFVYEVHRLSFLHAKEDGPSGSTLAHRGLHRLRVARTKAAEARTVRQADGLVCLTGGVREALSATFAASAPALVLPSGVHLPEAEPPGDAQRDLDVLYVGKLVERKGVYDLVQAMRFLPERRLSLVGGGEREVQRLVRFAGQIGVEDRVSCTGYVEPAHVSAFYRRARVGVCPLPVGVSRISEHFTSPLKILDMMAHGTPIVATDLPSVREILTHDRTALLAPPSQPEALAAALRTMLDDRTEAGRLAQAAWRAVQAYTWTNRARRLSAFLDALP